MIKTTRTLIRNDIDTPWHIDEPFRSIVLTQEFLDHVEFNYSGKQTNQTWSRSDDSLSITFTAYWESLEDFQTYINDPVCVAMFARRDAHNAQFGITSEPSAIQEL